MVTTKELIIDYIGQQQTTTAVEISRALHLTPANIRYHLSNLLQTEDVIEEDEMMTTRRGRPSKIYRLARHPARDTYLSMTRSLLLAIQSTQSPLPTQEIARALGAPSNTDRTKHTIHHLNTAIHSLNKYGHKANWIASKDGPTIELHGCPFRQLIDQHPELCSIDLEVINLSTGAEFEQIEKLKMDARKRIICRFKLKQRTTSGL